MLTNKGNIANELVFNSVPLQSSSAVILMELIQMELKSIFVFQYNTLTNNTAITIPGVKPVRELTAVHACDTSIVRFIIVAIINPAFISSR